MEKTLAETIEAYRARHGEPEYRYFKKRAIYSHSSRGFILPIGEGEEVTKDEYEASIKESDRLGDEAFWGRLKQTYWRYYRNMSKDGWREALIKDVEAA